MRAASWAAVSSRPQADKISLEEQHRRNKEKIQELGGVCVADLTVPGASRKIVLFEEACGRISAYAELKDLVDRKQIDLLVFFVKSRLGRMMSLCETVVAYCQAHGVAVYDLSAPPSTLDAAQQMRSAGDTITSAVTSWQSQRESSELWQKHADGMIGRIKEGKMPSHIPQVWRKVYDRDGNEHLEINEDIAAPVRKILELYANGHSEVAIVSIMNETGYKNEMIKKGTRRDSSKRAWTRAAIRSVLDRAWTYAGYAQINRASPSGREYTRAPGNFAPIITEEIAERIDAERRAKRRVRNFDRPQFVFSSFVRCAPCNAGMTIASLGSSKKLPDGSYHYYPMLRCPKCKRQVSISKVRSALLQWFRDLSKPKERLKLVSTADRDDATNAQSEVARLENQLQTIADAKNKANNAYIDGLMDRGEYATQKQRLATEEKEIRLILARLKRQLTTVRTPEENAALLKTLADAGALLLDDPNISEVNAWLRQRVVATFDANRKLHFDYK